MKERNVELLQQTMQFIKDHPEQHDQDFWGLKNECDTTACFAGWAILLSGRAKLNQVEGCFTARNNREIQSVSRYAGKLLGLTEYEAEIMFLDADTAEELELMVKDLVNGEKLKDIYHYREMLDDVSE